MTRLTRSTLLELQRMLSASRLETVGFAEDITSYLKLDSEDPFFYELFSSSTLFTRKVSRRRTLEVFLSRCRDPQKDLGLIVSEYLLRTLPEVEVESILPTQMTLPPRVK